MTMRVIVIGAGLGGLALAQGLIRRGVDVVVYERDASFTARRQGYRIHIDGDGDRALEAFLPPALYELFRATAYEPLYRTPVYNQELEQLALIESADADRHVSVNRLTLRQILAHGVPVRFGARLVAYTEGDRIEARFADGTVDAAEVLVGADGINSVVRAQLLPHAHIVDIGLRQLYGKIPLDRNLLLDGMYSVFTPILGPDRSYVGVGPVVHPEPPQRAADRLAPGLRLHETGDYVTVSYGARRDLLPPDDELRDMSGAALRSLVLHRIRDWDPRVRALVERWDTGSIFPLTLRSSLPVAPWPAGRVTLLGDAVHAMSPAAGVGANTALRDAATLAGALPDVASYEQVMRDYGFAAVRRSAANAERMLGADPLPLI
jgi:2-polyprenyl-6-methoxyphenol hydroxylase-like FAD-dependent oxidoreductase